MLDRPEQEIQVQKSDIFDISELLFLLILRKLIV